jgi:hypothetical protein
MVPRSMSPRTLPRRRIAIAAVVAVSLAGNGCERATLPDQGPVRPSTLVFSLQPEYGTAGSPIGPGIGVTVMESNGDTAIYTTALIQLSILSGSGTRGAHLLGPTQAYTVNGTALFSSVSIDSAGLGYVLVASGPLLHSAASAPFDIVAGGPVKLGFVQQPSDAVAGDSIVPAVRVAAQDKLGNTVLTSRASISVGLGVNPGSATLGGVAVRRADSGVAKFPGLSVSAPASGYTLEASADGLATATSVPFTITAAGVAPPSRRPAR